MTAIFTRDPHTGSTVTANLEAMLEVIAVLEHHDIDPTDPEEVARVAKVCTDCGSIATSPSEADRNTHASELDLTCCSSADTYYFQSTQ